MGIVSDPRGRGKGFVTPGQRGASPTQGWTRERWGRADPPEGRESATGVTGRRSSRGAGSRGHRPRVP